MIDPNQFIISRKRKKYKFAKFANSPLCFELEEWTKQPVDVIEVGAGTGLFSVELAARHPEQTFMAVDVKADRLQKGAYDAEERGLTNIYFVRARADQLAQLVPETSLRSLWLTFSDPFPKARSAGRRMTHPTYLGVYRSLLRSQGSLFIKHDDIDFIHWTLEQLVAEKWHITELSFDLHDSELHSDYKIMTSYEERWQAEGRKTYYLKASHA